MMHGPMNVKSYIVVDNSLSKASFYFLSIASVKSALTFDFTKPIHFKKTLLDKQRTRV
jgi:hypothetical protein